MTVDQVRVSLAQIVCDALRREGWIIPPSGGFAVADALRERPGLVRRLVEDDPKPSGVWMNCWCGESFGIDSPDALEDARTHMDSHLPSESRPTGWIDGG